MAAGTCPKCTGTMEEGFIVDRSHYRMMEEARWVQGEPERGFWWGLKTSGKRSHAVSTWRCAKCGYLESYATSKPVRGV